MKCKRKHGKHLNLFLILVDLILKKNIYIYELSLQFGGCYTSSAQGGGGSFKNRKPIGRVGCCDSQMAERIH